MRIHFYICLRKGCEFNNKKEVGDTPFYCFLIEPALLSHVFSEFAFKCQIAIFIHPRIHKFIQILPNQMYIT